MVNPDPVALTILGKDIYWYGITMATGVLCGLFVAMRSAPLYRWKTDDILDFVIMAIPISLVCARAYYVAFEWEIYANNPISVLFIWQGGLALYGSLIGAILSAVIFTAWKKYRLIDLLDICSPGFALGQAIGRWGNFFNQEAYGAQITDPALAWFPFAVKIDATNTIHYATFFYESAWCLMLCVFLLICRRHFRHSGDVFVSFLSLYGFERMIVEGLRTDSLYLWSTNIRVSQFIAATCFTICAVYLAARFAMDIKNGVVITNKCNPDYDWHDTAPASAADEIDALDRELEAETAEMAAEIEADAAEIAEVKKRAGLENTFTAPETPSEASQQAQSEDADKEQNDA